MILDRIVQNSRRELEIKKRHVPIEMVRKLALEQTPPLDFSLSLQGGYVRIIAELKKASPSRGIICRNFDPVAIARIYAENGAAAISVLTDNKYFGGRLGYLLDIKGALGNTRPPLLRKDFIFDSYQVYESRAYGADAILLIVAILKPEEVHTLLDLSCRMHMQCLLEAHDENELNIALHSGAQIIGINNRDLQTFTVDMNTTARLRPLVPPDRIVVSESGIRTPEDIKKLRCWGVNAALVGETLLSSPDIAAKMRELL
jgi:indole-3-glycerol phosphate synthase